MVFPDGQKRTFDRCDTHASKFERFREEPGQWERKQKRAGYKVKSIDEVLGEAKGK